MQFLTLALWLLVVLSLLHSIMPSFSGCDQICSEPLTLTPIGSPCSCVYPMQVELILGVAPLAVFPLVPELEIEIAAGTFLKQSQVRIMGATANIPDQEKTTVNIDLVPLVERFDAKTAQLTYDRFWQKKVGINMTLFGDYSVVYVYYPGLPSAPFINSRSMGIGPSKSSSTLQSQGNPFAVNVTDMPKINARTSVLISFSSFLLFLACMVVLFSKFKRLGRSSSTGDPAVSPKRSGSTATLSLTSTTTTCMLSVKTFTLSELENATNMFSFDRILGEGGFGRVYHGIMEDGSEVAIKVMRREGRSKDQEFIVEFEMLTQLRHCNLVELIGICIEDNMRCLVYELVRNGSVESHLHGINKRKGLLDWDARLKIALGAARGLAYLHEDSNPHVIHRDFKSSNILLEEDFTPKISDFGLARAALEGSQHISTRVMGTFGYVAPEYAMTGHLLVKSDVYSYGVVLLELLSGRKPIDMARPQGQENLVTWARPLLTSRDGLDQLIDPSLVDGYNFDKMAKVAAIALMCVHPEVSHRPFMGEVVQELKLVYNDTDDTCRSSCNQEDLSYVTDYRSRGDFDPDSSCWNESTPCSAFQCSCPFATLECSSSVLEEMKKPISASPMVGRTGSLMWHNRSVDLQRMHSKLAFYRLKGSVSEHGFFSRNPLSERYFWV